MDQVHPLAEELLVELESESHERNASRGAPYKKGGEKYQEFLRGHQGVEAGPKLHGQKEPGVAIEKEKPIHRLMAYWVAQGKSMVEIADESGYNIGYVRQICRQPWFQDYVTYLIHQAGDDEIQKRLAGAAIDSIVKLIELRDSSPSETVKLGATKELLDRYLGKAPQTINNRHTTLTPQDELASLEREQASIEQQIKRQVAV